MNLLGINLWNWRPGLDRECAALPEHVAALGFDAVELPMTDSALPEGMEQALRRSGLAVTMCAALGPGRDLSSPDEAVRRSTMDYLTECLRTGASVGATVLCGPLYTGGGKRHTLPPEEKAREWERAVTGLRELARRAGDWGVSLSLEPLNRYRPSVANTAAQVLTMIEDVGEAGVGLHFDTYHACLEEKDLLRALEGALESGRVNHFHACANNRGAPGQGVIPWDDVMDLLVRYGYAGHITMETFAPGGLDASWVQVHEPPDELALAGLGYLRGYFARRAGKEIQ